ncbi:cell division protein [Bacillus coahuilensis m2-6]|uniref:cell division protein FtsA n=1 Tax=Bacillus coahuilensis TaxID=408580 RepID=UPI0007504674|nr:cell division protein FtsA [Bacillus coahuilensis]KUP06705.1 cell division protein [Bacillus coahuilensis m2-6]
MEQSKIFALDIGTRSVVGIILQELEGKYEVIDVLSIEHKERAMLDGQIHDVVAVSEVIQDVKMQLERKHGSLKRVCVAAAGRALKTERASAVLPIKGKPELTKEDVLHLELSAVQQAQSTAAEQAQESKSHHYYCVGYSVLYYRLDGEEIGNLIDQQGNEASVDIIATFLPRVVVESLISALKRADLEMEALTLEPIAAINVLIPPSMRRLNVALVDIGAGTSDIAITDAGTVIAYGMVPVAGDEITEALSDQFLLDFPLAEKAKKELIANGSISIEDILGFQSEVTKEDAVEKISYSIDRLGEEITNELKRLNNQKPPKAVMLVGGGSLTPNLPKVVAENLGLPENRVAIRGIDAIQNIKLHDTDYFGPELVTPIGIAIAAKQSPVQYMTTYVNEQPIRLFEVKSLTVGDSLLAAGLQFNKMYGKPGLGLVLTVNQQAITVPGYHGEPPEFTKNGQPCSLDDPITNEDRITVVKGKDGLPAKVTIQDFMDSVPSFTVFVDKKKVFLDTFIEKNGKQAKPSDGLFDGDRLTLSNEFTVEHVLRSNRLEHWLQKMKPFYITLEGKEIFFPPLTGKLLVNGKMVRPSHKLQPNDKITFEEAEIPSWGKIAIRKQLSLEKQIQVFFQGAPLSLSKETVSAFRNGEKLTADSVLKSGDEIRLTYKEATPFIFQDIFTKADVDIPKHSVGNYQLLRNGQPSAFDEPIETGDTLEINFQPSSKNLK